VIDGTAGSHPQRWNRYLYTAGNPLKFIDPDGATITVPKWLSNVIADALKRSLTFRNIYNRLDADRRVNVTFARQVRPKPGSRIDSSIAINRTRAGAITALKQQVNIPPGAANAHGIGHELFHGVEILDTGKSLEERFKGGERGVRENATGWESDAALEAERTIRIEISQSPPPLSAVGYLEALSAGFGMVVYIEGVRMPF
jgi:hypothetical protein